MISRRKQGEPTPGDDVSPLLSMFWNNRKRSCIAATDLRPAQTAELETRVAVECDGHRHSQQPQP